MKAYDFRYDITFAVLIGGSLGTLLRYLLVLLFPFDGIHFPWGTFIANLGGSFILGCWTGWFLQRQLPQWLKLGIGTGFCGGYTTMSTFIMEAVTWQGDTVLLGIYMASTLFIGIGLTWIGWLTGDAIGLKNMNRPKKAEQAKPVTVTDREAD
jgi:CrcB protein